MRYLGTHHLPYNPYHMRYLVYSPPQLLILQDASREDTLDLLVRKSQPQDCSQPAPPIPDLLEQFLEITPILLKDACEEAQLVRIMKDNVDTGPDSLV